MQRENGVHAVFEQSDLFERVTGTYERDRVKSAVYSVCGYFKSDAGGTAVRPPEALDGKEDGLYFYRRIAEEPKEYLNADGRIFLEIGYNRGALFRNCLYKLGFRAFVS